MNLRPHLPGHAESTIHQFLRAQALGDGGRGVVLGLSGGIDSALAARLAVDALGADRVLGALLPDAAFPADLAEETRGYAKGLGVELVELPIDPLESAVRGQFPAVSDRTTWGNVKARARMIILYTLARERGLRVMGTGNKSELLVGYFTNGGEGGVDLLPIGDLYKTQVRELSHRLGLPEPIRTRPPTAGLWPGQTDEEELGLPYEVLDQILFGLEQLASPDAIAQATGQPPEVVASVEARVLSSRHKRRMPPVAKVGLRTIGIDWRE